MGKPEQLIPRVSRVPCLTAPHVIVERNLYPGGGLALLGIFVTNHAGLPLKPEPHRLCFRFAARSAGGFHLIPPTTGTALLHPEQLCMWIV